MEIAAVDLRGKIVFYSAVPVFLTFFVMISLFLRLIFQAAAILKDNTFLWASIKRMMSKLSSSILDPLILLAQ